MKMSGHGRSNTNESSLRGEKGTGDVFLQCLPFLSNQVTAIKEYHFPLESTLTGKPNVLSAFAQTYRALVQVEAWREKEERY